MIINIDSHKKEKEYEGPFRSFDESVMDSGCYYLLPEICKDIIISLGVSGVHTSEAVKKIRQNIGQVRNLMEDNIPIFGYINSNTLLYYAGELAECLVKAADIGKGVEIIIGYPKILVCKIG